MSVPSRVLVVTAFIKPMRDGAMIREGEIAKTITDLEGIIRAHPTAPDDGMPCILVVKPTGRKGPGGRGEEFEDVVAIHVNGKHFVPRPIDKGQPT